MACVEESKSDYKVSQYGLTGQVLRALGIGDIETNERINVVKWQYRRGLTYGLSGRRIIGSCMTAPFDEVSRIGW